MAIKNCLLKISRPSKPIIFKTKSIYDYFWHPYCLLASFVNWDSIFYNLLVEVVKASLKNKSHCFTKRIYSKS